MKPFFINIVHNLAKSIRPAVDSSVGVDDDGGGNDGGAERAFGA